MQEKVLGIPLEYLSRHAYHKISIGDSNVRVTFETKVFGHAPSAAGLAEIIGALTKRRLENRVYDVLGSGIGIIEEKLTSNDVTVTTTNEDDLSIFNYLVTESGKISSSVCIGCLQHTCHLRFTYSVAVREQLLPVNKSNLIHSLSKAEERPGEAFWTWIFPPF